MKKENIEKQLIENMKRLDKSFKPKLNEEFGINNEDVKVTRTHEYNIALQKTINQIYAQLIFDGLKPRDAISEILTMVNIAIDSVGRKPMGETSLNEMPTGGHDPLISFKSDWDYPARKDYERFINWYNPQESKFYQSDDGETTTLTYVLDIPKAEFNPDDIELLKHEYKGSSHGVEGNPGGIVAKGWVTEPEDMGDFYRVTIERSFILDV